jgi:hypothetical protein
VAKANAKATILALAQRAEPDFASMIEHGSPLTFPIVSLQSMVHGVETPAMGFTEAADSVGLMCYLFSDQLLAKINAGIDAVSDDKAALNEKQRAEMEAQIMADALVIERSEGALIWHAEAKGEVIDFRSDTSPQAVLGVRKTRHGISHCTSEIGTKQTCRRLARMSASEGSADIVKLSAF